MWNWAFWNISNLQDGSAHTVSANYSGLYEQGEVKHINVPSLPIPVVTKTVLAYSQREFFQMGQIQTVLTRKKTKVSVATGGFKANYSYWLMQPQWSQR